MTWISLSLLEVYVSESSMMSVFQRDYRFHKPVKQKFFTMKRCCPNPWKLFGHPWLYD
ncbi:MAG: hypothetical protein LBE12_16000 [Planctomycetaceae bacterium]|nr:hypothetical protein [Planctomycetaceae bacterium]